MWNIVGQLNELQKRAETAFEEAVQDRGDEAGEPAAVPEAGVPRAAEPAEPLEIPPPAVDGGRDRLAAPGSSPTPPAPTPVALDFPVVASAPAPPSSDAFFDDMFGPTEPAGLGPSAAEASASNNAAVSLESDVVAPLPPQVSSSVAAGVAEASSAPLASSAAADPWGELDMLQAEADPAPSESTTQAPSSSIEAGVTESSGTGVPPSAAADPWGDMDMLQAEAEPVAFGRTAQAPQLDLLGGIEDKQQKGSSQKDQGPENAAGDMFADLEELPAVSVGGAAPAVRKQALEAAMGFDAWGNDLEAEPAIATFTEMQGAKPASASNSLDILVSTAHAQEQPNDRETKLANTIAVEADAPSKSNSAGALEHKGHPLEPEPDAGLPAGFRSPQAPDAQSESAVVGPGAAQGQIGHPLEAQGQVRHPLAAQPQTGEANAPVESSATGDQGGLLLGPPTSPQKCAQYSETERRLLEGSVAPRHDSEQRISNPLDSHREVAGDQAAAEGDQAAAEGGDARALPANAQETGGDTREEEGAKSTPPPTQHPAGGDDGDDLIPRLQHWATGVYEIHNPSKLPEIPKIFEKYKGREVDLVRGIARKYGVPPPPELYVPEAAPEPEVSSWFQAPASFSMNINTDGLLAGAMSGIQSLQETAATIQDKAGGLRDNVERQFEEAIRSQEDAGQSEGDAALPAQPRVSVQEMEAAPPQLEDSAALQALREMDEEVAAPEPAVEQEAAVLGEVAAVTVAVASSSEAVVPECSSAASEPVDAEQDGAVSPTQAASAGSEPASPTREQSQPVAPDPRVEPAPDQSAALAARDQDIVKWKGLARGLAKELEAVRGDHKAIAKTVEALRAERAGLMEEGLKMSKRVQTVEAAMKKTLAEARSAENRVMELQRTRDGMQSQVDKLTARAESSDIACGEQRAELKRLAAEAERSRGLMEGEQRRNEAEKQALQQMGHKQGERDRALEDRLESTGRERAELLATNASLSNELQRALAMADSTESQCQAHLQEAAMTNEEQRRRIEVLEMEYASSSLPSTQRIASLEGSLARQEQLLGEREKAAREQLASARAELEKERRESEERAEAQRGELRELQEKVQSSGTAVTEATRAQSRAQEEWQKREAADRARELAEAELRLAMQRKSSEEARAAELERQIADLKRQLSLAQQLSTTTPSPSSPATNRPEDGAAAPAASAAPTAELEQESRRLRSEVEGLARQRDLLERDSSRLQAQLDSQARAGAGKKATVPLETKFEAALQAIGKLQEELETCRDQREQYKAQCQQLVQVLGRK